MPTVKAKLTIELLLILTVIVIMGFLAVWCVRVGFTAVQTALKVDEKMAQTTAISINKSTIDQAYGLITKPQAPEINWQVTEASLGAQISYKISLINGSGEQNLASIAGIFAETDSVAIQQSEKPLDETQLLYNNGIADVKINAWVQQLKALGWTSVTVQAQTEAVAEDVVIILGKKS